jgi:G3E family GTPase
LAKLIEVQQDSETRIRMIVLGGYLGSGKTTWLRHQLHNGGFKDAHVIVNEAAEIPVDDALLQKASCLSVLAGGCACCAGKPQLLQLLRRLSDERSRVTSTQKRLELIVLETSGLADPGAIVEAIRIDPVLVNHIVVSEVLVTVDALHALSNLRGEPSGRRQIEAADTFIVTKLDSAPPADIAVLLATLHSLNPGAKMTGSVLGSDTPLPAFEIASAEVLPPLEGDEHRPAIFPTRLAINDDIDWAAFSVWLSALLHARGDDVVRVKGVVQTPAGRLLLQTVRKVVQSPEILPAQGEAREDNTIVVIGRGYDADDLKRSLHRFAGATGP